MRGLTLESCWIQTKFGLHILPFLCGLGVSNDLLAKVLFPGDNMGFQGRSRPKFQDLNIDKSVGEIFGCLEVSG
jgi:hypothetical protein